MEIDQESRRAFGAGISVDRYAGSVITLRLGERPTFEHIDGSPTRSYLSALRRLPKLETQGDGVRSYLGLILNLTAGSHQILLIDEPEAFLHPPQARMLGSVLSKKGESKQVFAATHSSDILQGVIEGGTPVRIIRITRDGELNHASVLDDSAVKDLWSDPLLRYSNVLDGLFHDAVVLCEGDADCRYYSAIIGNLLSDREYVATSPRDPQLLFTHCGGKTRMPTVIRALRAVKVPVVAVADFDVLRNPNDMKAIVEALGGEYSKLERNLNVLQNALKPNQKGLVKEELRAKVNEILDRMEGQVLEQKDINSVKSLLRAPSGWEAVKKSGINGIPQGDASKACRELLEGLKELGLLVVPVGELERFVPEAAGHGPSWVSNVFEGNMHTATNSQASDFAAEILAATQK